MNIDSDSGEPVSTTITSTVSPFVFRSGSSTAMSARIEARPASHPP